jgi:hypothetical protein
MSYLKLLQDNPISIPILYCIIQNRTHPQEKTDFDLGTMGSTLGPSLALALVLGIGLGRHYSLLQKC